MRIKKMLSLIDKSVPYDEQSLEELKNLLEECPYFQLAHLLYTLNLHDLKDSCFKQELQKTAAYLPDRKKLFFLLESDFFSPKRIRNLEEETDEISSFELIDSFLHNKTSEETGNTPVMDYLSYLLSDESGETASSVPPMRHEDKIDRFIEEDKKKTFQFDLKNLPEEEEELLSPFEEEPEEDDFFSETLAKIYIKQRKYDKALKIIRELNLLYPEKNRYFADQIRFLEKLIINTSKIK